MTCYLNKEKIRKSGLDNLFATNTCELPEIKDQDLLSACVQGHMRSVKSNDDGTNH